MQVQKEKKREAKMLFRQKASFPKGQNKATEESGKSQRQQVSEVWRS